MRLLFLLLCVALPSTAIKILVFNPCFATSHVRTLNRIAEVLAEKGHDVVEVFSLNSPLVHPPSASHPAVRRIVVPAPPSEADNEAMFTQFIEQVAIVSWQRGYTPLEALEWNTLTDSNVAQCRFTLSYPGLLEQLRQEKFDFAITEAFDMCGLGVFRLAGIDKYALAATTGLVEFVGDAMQLPNSLSYIPGVFSPVGGSMTFSERAMNVIAKWSLDYFFGYGEGYYDALFKEFDPATPPLKSLLASASLMFTNDDPLLDFPRPLLSKIVSIGGISVLPPEQEKPLEESWSSILSRRPRNVLVSFGTILLSRLMPLNYKHALVHAFSRFNDTTFIWKYESADGSPAVGVDNVVVREWLPQSALLSDPRVSLFVTHSGMASTQEAVQRAVPMLTVPLFTDQYRNAKMMERAGSSLFFPKTDLGDADKIEAALRKMLDDTSFSTRAALLRDQSLARPFSPSSLLTRHVEFAAAYGPLSSLDPSDARQLNYIQLHLFDVYAAFAVVALTAAYFVYRITRCMVQRIRIGKKEKLN